LEFVISKDIILLNDSNHRTSKLLEIALHSKKTPWKTK